MTFFVFFWARKIGTSEYALRILRFCDVAITPLARVWPAGLSLRPRSGKKASEIDIVRILRGAEESVTAVGVVGVMRPAIPPALARA